MSWRGVLAGAALGTVAGTIMGAALGFALVALLGWIASPPSYLRELGPAEIVCDAVLGCFA